MKNFFKNIPGFRSGVTWKKVFAIGAYPLITFFIFVLLLANTNTYTRLLYDSFIKTLENLLITLTIFIVPFVLITNVGNIRNQLPLLKSKSLGKRVLGWAVSSVLLLSILLFGLTGLQQLYSKEYMVEHEAYQVERDRIAAEQTVVKEAAEAEERKQREAERLAAEEEKKKMAEQEAAAKVEEVARKEAE